MDSAAQSPLVSLDDVETERVSIFWQALQNILSLPDVEVTYAQIVDGLPLFTVYDESRWPIPSIITGHTQLCDGALDRVRAARDQFDISTLRFNEKAIRRYQDTRIGSVAFSLYLIELVVVACHQIAAALYQLSEGESIHSRESVQAEMEKNRAAVPHNRPWDRDRLPHETYFYNGYYRSHEQYPYGVADVVGYWAETRIFGGVAVFDRGLREDGNHGVYFHSDRETFGHTLYPPTEAQFTSLVRFLSTPVSTDTPEEVPIPIVPSIDNRWRWDNGYAFRDWHIFRDRYERVVPSNYRPNRHRMRASDWPEVAALGTLMQQQDAEQGGEPVDEETLAKAQENMKRITPTSPRWWGPQPNKDEEQTNVFVQWKPPYFQDPEKIV